MSDRVLNVLFVCTANSARSIIGECLLNHLARGRFRAYSAGSHPASKPNPLALVVLEQRGVPTVGVRSKSWDEFCDPGAPLLDYVLIVCARPDDEYMPEWRGNPVVSNWCLGDPATVSGPDDVRLEAFSRTYDELERRILAFRSLPLNGASRPALQRWLDLVGSMEPSVVHPDERQAVG